MIEAEIKSTENLPDSLRWLDDLKIKSERVSERLQPSHPDHAARIYTCADTVKLIAFPSGFKILKPSQQRFCHIRGCPLCERTMHRKKMGRIYGGIVEARKRFKTHKWMLLTLSTQGVTPNALNSEITKLNEAFRRLTKLTLFKSNDYVRLLNIDYLCGQFLPNLHVLILANASFYEGRNYTSRAAWQAAWDQSCRMKAPPIVVRRLGQQPKDICKKLGATGRIDLAMIDAEHLSGYFTAISGLRFFSTSGLCNSLMAERPRAKKHYAPSEIAQLQQMESLDFAYLPNPADESFANQYLKLVV